MSPDERHSTTRWPGWDGWLLGAVGVLIAVLQLVRQVESMWIPVVTALAVYGGYLLLTYGFRRKPRRAYPVHPLRILTVIPTKDNAGSIEDVVVGCLAHTSDLLVVDDGCTDGSGELAAAAGATVVKHEVNLGKGAALETALDWAAANGFSHIVAIDADGQHEPDDLPSFYEAIRKQPDAIIAGVRDMSEAPSSARYARANSNFWVRVESSQWMGDTQCGYRAFPVEPVRQLNLVPSRYQWEVEVLVRAVWNGIPVVDHPCRVFYPPAEERVSSYRKFVDTARISWLNAHLIAERVLWPPRWFPGKGGWQGSARGFTLGWKLYLWLLKLFGRGPVKIALIPLVGFYWLFLGAQQRGVDAYLSRRFPDDSGLARSLKRFRLLLNFAYSIVDRVHVLTTGGQDIELDRTGVPGLADKLYDTDEGRQRGLMMVSGHLGNPDLGGMLLRHKERQVHLLLYQDPQDPYFQILREAMGEMAPKFIQINEGRMAAIAAVNAMRDGDVVAAKGDRVVDARFAEVEFLGGTIRVPTGPLLLAAMAKCPVVFMGYFQDGPNRYRLEASGPHQLVFGSRKERDADLQRWAQQWADVMAAWTERYPLQWYNFFDPWDAAR